MKRCVLPLAAAAVLGTAASHAQTLGPDFEGDYLVIDLGPVPGVPVQYTGVGFRSDDPTRLLLSGNVGAGRGDVYACLLSRDSQGHITGFVDSVLETTCWQNDGGLSVGPEGVLFFSTSSSNTAWWVGQIRPGDGVVSRWDDLVGATLDQYQIEPPRAGGLAFVPAGFPGAGRLKLASYNGDEWYDAQVVPDGLGTYDIVGLVRRRTGIDSPEGLAYVHSIYPGLRADSVLVCQFDYGQVGAFEIDEHGDPDLNARRTFFRLPSATGIAVDPFTGDIVVSAYSPLNRLYLLQPVHWRRLARDAGAPAGPVERSL